MWHKENLGKCALEGMSQERSRDLELGKAVMLLALTFDYFTAK